MPGNPFKAYRFEADMLLSETTEEPCWTKLPKPIKRALCKCVFMDFGLIHDKRFYERLHSTWTDARTYKLEKQSSNSPCIECSICLDTYKLDGKDKVTTLLCGHKFCTKCIFRYIVGRLCDNSVSEHTSTPPSCPMCRSNVFKPPTSERVRAEQCAQAQAVRVFTEKKRARRQRERRAKRQRVKSRTSN